MLAINDRNAFSRPKHGIERPLCADALSGAGQGRRTRPSDNPPLRQPASFNPVKRYQMELAAETHA